MHVRGENRENWMPLFDRFVDREAVALVCSDEGATYLNIGDHYNVDHETVCHNRRFVNPKRQ